MSCGYPLEVPHQGASNKYPQHIFLWRDKENIYVPDTHSYLDLCIIFIFMENCRKRLSEQASNITIPQDKMLFSTIKYGFLSYFSIKLILWVLIRSTSPSTNNILVHGEIRKKRFWILLGLLSNKPPGIMNSCFCFCGSEFYGPTLLMLCQTIQLS